MLPKGKRKERRHCQYEPTNEPRHGVVDHQWWQGLDSIPPGYSLVICGDDTVGDQDGEEAEKAKCLHEEK